MAERRLAPLAAVAGIACCLGTALAAVAIGGVALASLGRFGAVSGATLVVVVGLAWLLDRRNDLTDHTDHDTDTQEHR